MSTAATTPDSAGGVPISVERWLLVSTILASSMGFISSSALNVAIPALQEGLDANAQQILWILNAYLLPVSSLILVGGSLGDHYGRKRIFGYGIIVFTLASIACGLSPNANFLIAVRFVQGIGAALMIPGSLSIITALVADDRRGEAIGTWSALGAVTTIAGPVLGGFLADYGLWRFVFFINVPLAVVALYALYRHVPESRDDEVDDELDFVGALLATAGLGLVSYAFIRASEQGLSDQWVLVSLVAGIATFVGFVVWERVYDHPMMPLRLFASRTFSGTNLMTFFLYAALSGGTFFLTLNLIQVQGYPETVAGLTLLPLAASLVIFSRYAGKGLDRFGPRPFLTFGPIIVGFAFIAWVFPTTPGGPGAYGINYFQTYFPGALFIGIGMGITVAPLTTTVMSAVPKHQSGTASGINNAVSRTGQALAIAIVGAVAIIAFSAQLDTRAADAALGEDVRAALQEQSENLGNAQVPDIVTEENARVVERIIDLAFVDAFRLICYVCAGMCWLSAALSWFLVNEPGKGASTTPAPDAAGT